MKAIDMKPECLAPGCTNVIADNFTEYCYRCACRDPLSHNAGREHGQPSCHCLVEDDKQSRREKLLTELTQLSQELGLYDETEGVVLRRTDNGQHVIVDELTQINQELGLHEGVEDVATTEEQRDEAEEAEYVISLIAAAFEQEDLPEDHIDINHLARIAFEVVLDTYDWSQQVAAAEGEYIRDVDRDLIRKTTQQPIREGPAADLDIEDFHHRHRHQLREDIEFYLSCSSCGATVDEECDYSCPEKDNRKERIRNYMKTSESMVNEAISDGLTLPCMRCGHIPHVDYRVDDQFWREATNEDERLNVVCIECLARDNPDIALHIEEIQIVNGTITTVFHPSKVVPHEEIGVKDSSEPCDDFEAAKDYPNICTWCGHKDKHHDEESDSLKGLSPVKPPVRKAGTIKMSLTNPKRGHGSDTTVTSAEVPPPNAIREAHIPPLEDDDDEQCQCGHTSVKHETAEPHRCFMCGCRSYVAPL